MRSRFLILTFIVICFTVVSAQAQYQEQLRRYGYVSARPAVIQAVHAISTPTAGVPNINPTKPRIRPFARFQSRPQAVPQDQYADGINLYQYCGSNPLSYVDPYGLEFYDRWGSYHYSDYKVSCSTIEEHNDRSDDEIGRLLGLRHCEITWREIPADEKDVEIWDVEVDRSSARKMHHPNKSEKPCMCVSDDEIKSCVNAIYQDVVTYNYHRVGNNCHTATAKGLSRCCLKSTWRPSWHAGDWRCKRWEQITAGSIYGPPQYICVEWYPDYRSGE